MQNAGLVPAFLFRAADVLPVIRESGTNAYCLFEESPDSASAQ
jgi:hypothetical protein